jgi:hypothetical protein
VAKGIDLQNVVLSSNPCPSCAEANGKIMTITEWKKSKWGLPGSMKRLCKKFCHCILVPVNMVAQLPAIGERVKLRGDEGSDIRPVVELSPNELYLKELMDDYNAKIGKLPPEIYDMPLLDVIPFLEKLLGRKR